MKKRRFISLLMVFVLCFSLFPTQAFAWKNLTHVNSANIILLEMQRSGGKVTLGGNEYQVPAEFRDAIYAYPDAFRAGSMGPDFYPDIIVGQMFIHPMDDKDIGSGEWVKLLCEALNRMPENSDERREALAFTLGVMLHFSGDLFGHDFINAFSGAAYPAVTSVRPASDNKELNIILSHMAEEAYMDNLVNWGFYDNAHYMNNYNRSTNYLNIDAPTEFVANSMIYDGSANGGPAKIYEKYGSVPPHFKFLLNVRTKLYNKANDWRTSVNPIYSGLVLVFDRWIANIDEATYALVDTFDRIANRMVTEADPSMLGIVKGELNNWVNEYGVYMIPVPDALIDTLKVPGEAVEVLLTTVGLEELVKEFNEWKKNLILDGVKWALGVSEEDLAVIYEVRVRLEDPETQLDHADNPFKPAEDNFAEFKEYMDRYAAEQKLLNGLDERDLINGRDRGALDKLIDSDLEAFYNTMAMFKMVLIGPENFKTFVERMGVTDEALLDKVEDVYHASKGKLAATRLKLVITTNDSQGAGTDDNIYAVIYRNNGSARTLVTEKLLDISGTNDFEAGKTDTYYVELAEAVCIDELEIHIRQEGTTTAAGDWDCANIDVTPMHADTALTVTAGVGGNAHMAPGKTWNLRYQDALYQKKIADDYVAREEQEVMNLKIWFHTTDGTDGDVYLVAYNDGKEWVRVLLDKQNYNDFEKGDKDKVKDTYDVSLARITEERGIMKGRGIPLNDLSFKVIMEDNHTAAIGWDVKEATVTPYYGSQALTNEVNIGGYPDLRPGKEWNCEFDFTSFVVYTGISTLEYETNVDGGLLAYTNSLDDSSQWRAQDNILWGNGNNEIREKVFYNIFKGFAPEINYEGPEAIDEGDSFVIKLTFDGFWNGITTNRRNKAYAGDDAPPVEGTAVITFINSAGNEYKINNVEFENGEAIVTVKDGKVTVVKGEVTVEDDEATVVGEEATVVDDEATVADDGVTSNTNFVLPRGIYDVKVTYMTDGEYAPTEKIFEDALAVTKAELPAEKEDYFVNVIASPAEGGTVSGGDAIYTEGDTVTVTANANKYYEFVGWTEVVEENGIERVKPIDPEADRTRNPLKFNVAGNRELIANFEPLALTEIIVTEEPDKKGYYSGESFDSAGMVVTAIYGSGDKKDKKEISNYTLIDADDLKAGQTTVTISYTENGVPKTTTQEIEVKQNKLVALEVATPPDQTIYFVGDSFDRAGMVVNAVYFNGDKKEIEMYDKDINPNGYTLAVTDDLETVVGDLDELKETDEKVIISYTENDVTWTTEWKDIKVKPNSLTGLEVVTPPDQMEYFAGQVFNRDGMVVMAYYANGTTKEVYDYTLDNTMGLKLEDREVIISYTEGNITKTTTQRINVTLYESDGGSSSKRYDIVVDNFEDGSVEVNHKRAKKGSEITITTDPNKGYRAEDISVMTKGGLVVEVEDIGNGKFTFKMPSANVYVTVGTQKSVGYILLTIGNVLAEVLGKNVVNDVPPVIRNERTMLPARFIAEALGGTVTWNEPDQKVMIVKEGITLEIFINEPFAVVNGAPVELDSPAFIEKDRTYLPMRFIAENLGATVAWNAADQTIRITPGK